jgi:hypothetical protein
MQGYRSVSVTDAVCIVPRATQIRTELNRKIRTMARGLATLFHFRSLMNPVRHGPFALMLISHKLLRWLPYLLAPFAYLSLCLLSFRSESARILVVATTAGLLAGLFEMRRRTPASSKILGLAGFSVAVVTAGFLAWCAALRQSQLAIWEPTPRPGLRAS